MAFILHVNGIIVSLQHAVIADNVPPVFVLCEMFCLKRQTNDANDVQRYKKNDTVANFLDFFCDFTSLHAT